ncbi:phosphatidylserine synthase [Plasmopara halstedii]|uniref:Phosphatidylserine synthase n=1 Tax=Plasmopara halstedii TaxID=4781 RepID=A0A0P1AES6_PLAHL|nr:phosphatidylserine synthase [Plasmopara halstedii]CEG38978.1 phosphatidylserine synthase [Plasmopara halstedii]|eukprot:XP_024575347.1 phosphatidylserine synthase [Plasmopara halstedii]
MAIADVKLSSLRQRKGKSLSAVNTRNVANEIISKSPRSLHRSSPSPSWTYNTFRATHGNEIEGLLLFPEQPRQIFVLLLVVLAFSYYSFTHESQDTIQNTRDGLMMRPHPGLWRVVHGCSVVYLLLLAAMLVQNRESAIKGMQYVFPDVGSRPKMTISAQLQCKINAESLTRGMTSIWFCAHVTGWWGKMCMFRDWRFCWMISIAFEFLELALQFVIPDFQECWWDSLMLDLLGANMLGMCLGRITLWLLESKEYDWSGRRGKKMGYFRLALNQFTPLRWEQYHWEVFSSFSRFAEIVFAFAMCLLMEMNAFFLLTTLSIPKESNFNSYRLLLVFLLGIPAAAEYYEFITNPECWRLGQNAWMILSIATFEVLVWVKFSANGVLFTKAPPSLVLYPILAFMVMFSIWMLLFFCQKQRQPTSRRSFTLISRWDYLDVLFWASFVPLTFLASQWAY